VFVCFITVLVVYFFRQHSFVIGPAVIKHTHRAPYRGSVCVFYYCRTYYKAVRVGGGVFITAVPITKLFGTRDRLKKQNSGTALGTWLKVHPNKFASVL